MLADDESFAQAMDDYPDGAIFKAYVSGKTVMDEMRTSISADDAEFVDKVGNLDWLAAALRTSSDGIRFDTTVRGTPGSLLRSSHGATRRRTSSCRCPSSCRPTCSPTSAFHGVAGTLTEPRGQPDRSAGAGARASCGRSLGQVGTLVEGEDALYVRPSERRHPRGHARHDAARRAPTAPRRSTGSSTDADARRRGRVGRRSRAPTRGAIELGDSGSRSTTRTSATSSSSRPCRPGIEAVAHPASPARRGELVPATRSTPSELPDNVQSFFYVDIRGGLGLVEQLVGRADPGRGEAEREAAALGRRVRGEPAERGAAHVLRPDRRARARAEPRSSAAAARAGLPERLLARRVRGAGEHEQQVGEAVQVDGRERVRPAARPRRRAPRARRGGTRRARRAGARRPRCRPGGRSCAARAAARSRRRMSASSRSTCAAVDAQPAVVLGERHAEVGAEVEELVLDPLEPRVAARRPAPSRRSELSSSTAPNACTSGSSFETRDPSPSEVSPASPPRV